MKSLLVVGTLVAPISPAIVAADSIASPLQIQKIDKNENLDNAKINSISSEQMSQETQANINSNDLYIDSKLDNEQLSDQKINQRSNENLLHTLKQQDKQAKYDPIYLSMNKTTTYTFKVEYQLDFQVDAKNKYVFVAMEALWTVNYCNFYLETNYGRRIDLRNKSKIGYLPTRKIKLSPLNWNSDCTEQTLIITGTYTPSQSTINSFRENEYIDSIYFDIDYRQDWGSLTTTYSNAWINRYRIDVKNGTESSFHNVALEYPNNIKFENELNSTETNYRGDSFWDNYYLKERVEKKYEALELDVIAMTQAEFNSWKNMSTDQQIFKLFDLLRVDGKPIIDISQSTQKYKIGSLNFRNQSDIMIGICMNDGNNNYQYPILEVEIT